jgi:hypothetical protein
MQTLPRQALNADVKRAISASEARSKAYADQRIAHHARESMMGRWLMSLAFLAVCTVLNAIAALAVLR